MRSTDSLPLAIAMAEDLPPLIAKVSIHGPTLASIIQRFSSSPGDVDGLLFGHVAPLPPPDLPDDSPAAAAPQPPLFAAVVTAHFCSGAPMSFSDPLGRPLLPLLRRLSAGRRLLGWFSGRRQTPLRPSMREKALTLSLSKTLTLDPQSPNPNHPIVFLLLSSSSAPNRAVHTHEYRAFVSPTGGGALEPRSVDVVNLGPAFRAQYGSFSPESPFPMVPCKIRGCEEDGEGEKPRDSLPVGFGLERFGRLVGPGAAAYTAELEDLYGEMLRKLEGLARVVEKSSAEVLDQENRNLMLRSRLAGLK